MDWDAVRGLLSILVAPVLGLFAYFYKEHDNRIRSLESAFSSMATQMAVQQTLHNNMQSDRDEIKQDIKEIKLAMQDLLRQGIYYNKGRTKNG